MFGRNADSSHYGLVVTRMPLFLCAVVAAGAAATAHKSAFVVIVGFLAGALLLTAPPHICTVLAATYPWFIRPAIHLFSLPGILVYGDMPIALLALGVAMAAKSDVRTDEHRIFDGLRLRGALLAGSMALTWAIQGPHEPQRLLLAWMVTLQPLCVLAAGVLAFRGVSGTTVARACLCFVVVEFGYCAWQMLSGQSGDQVRGTLLGAGAGAHVLAAGVGVCMLALAVLHRSWVAGAAVVLFMVIAVAADAKQVLMSIPIALCGAVVVSAFGRSSHSGRIVLTLGLVIVAVGGGFYAHASASRSGLNIAESTVDQRAGKFLAADQLVAEMETQAPVAPLLGLGVASTMTRAAFITVPGYLYNFDAGSLGLAPARYSQLAQDASQQVISASSSSITSAQSSVLGIFFDYGIAGICCYLVIGGYIVKSLYRRRTPLAAMCAGLWIWAAALGILFDWMEQAPFTGLIAALSAAALSGVDDVAVDRAGQLVEAGTSR